MMRRFEITCFASVLLALLGSCITAKSNEPATIPAGSKVYVAPMDGFETYFKAALESKKVPLTVVENKQDAEYEITGVAGSQKAGAAKKHLRT